MENAAVLMLAMVAVLAIVGLTIHTSAVSEGAVIARPIIGDECQRFTCSDGLAPAKIKQYDGSVYCACGTYHAGPPPETIFEYDLSDGQWVDNP